MKDYFEREIKVGDYIVKLTAPKYYDNRCMFRIFGFDEEKENVYAVEWNMGWSKPKKKEEWKFACENPKEYYKKSGGFYGSAKRLNADVVVKIYPPVWQKYDDMGKLKK